MSPLQIQLNRIWRRSWLVLAVTSLTLAAVFSATWTEQTTYTGRSTLTINSEGRGPEQDAVLAQGYAVYFNESSYQNTLRKRAGVSAGVKLNARTAAASPIIYVEATAPDPNIVASAAAAMASAFRDDVNDHLRVEHKRAIDDLNNEIMAQRAELATVRDTSPKSSLITNTILALQERITAIQSENRNELQDLQLNAGVSSTSPNLVENIGLGLVGGLILGCLAALALATVENRLSTATEVRDQLGLDTLAVIPGGRSRSAAHGRAQHLMRLANLISLSDLPRPMTVAVTAPRAIIGTSQVAEGIATYRAVQGDRTLLIKADLHEEQHEPQPGVADFLVGPPGIGLDGVVHRGRTANMRVVPAGSSSADQFAFFSRDRFADLVEHAKRIADLVVIESPPITETAEGQVVCTTADRVILVIEENATRTTDATAARKLIEQVDATLLGVVITGSGSRAASSPLINGRNAPVPRIRAATGPEQPNSASDHVVDLPVELTERGEAG